MAQGKAAEKVEITGLADDSRRVGPGYLFAALPGTARDGRDFIPDAVGRGAAALLAPAGTVAEARARRIPADLPVVEDSEPRRRFALMAARFHPVQPEVICAVTGTNGKTSVVSFVRQIWARMGLGAASLGTLGITAPGVEEPGALTTPDPVALHAALQRLAGRGVSHLALEASSHGIEQCRLDGVRLAAAAFTNLSRDHLDYHGSEAAYFAAKARLFSTLLPADGMAVLNADAPEFGALWAVAARRGQRVISYGAEGRDVTVLRARPQGLGQAATLRIAGETRNVFVPLVGRFQLQNVACALGLVIATGGAAAEALDAVPHLEGAPGRMEPVGALANGAAVFVDYAHTPDALAHVLASLRPHAAGRLAVVFGCGGDRDRGKRPLMGRAAARGADRVIVTDDNPRTENAADIRAETLAGARAGAEVTEVGDRREAIRRAVAGLGPGDVLVVAGKGHERGQIVGTETRPFSDAEEVRAAIAAREELP